jgi:glutathione-regulated potassium-efflux system ancillary protein KefG
VRLIVYYAHPAQQYSHANKAMAAAARGVDGITFVDLYADYPRYDVDIDREQQRLVQHDVVLLLFPLFWYSTPSLLKEWIDLTLEHGFAYGTGGDKLAGKTMLVAITAAGPAEAYTEQGYQHYPLRTFLTPLERTAGLCNMRFAAPYALYGSIRAVEENRITDHAQGYAKLLQALRDDRFDFDAADALGVVQARHIDKLIGGGSVG